MSAGLVCTELRVTARRLRSTPVSTLTILLVLAIGIGANGALLMMWKSFLGTTLSSVREPQRVVALFSRSRADGWGMISIPDLRDYRRRLRSLERLAGYADTRVSLRGPERTEKVPAQVVTETYFGVLGVGVLRPGGGAPTEAPFSEDRQVVLSHDLWEERFGRDPAIVGAMIHVNGYPLTVVGVAPPGFAGTDPWSPAGLWMPLEAHRVAWPDYPPQLFEMRGAQLLVGLGRLRDGIGLSAANDEILTVASTLDPPVPKPRTEWTPELLSAAEGTSWPSIRRNVEEGLRALGVSTGLLLLVVTLIAGSLTAGRLIVREREVAVRVALGAGRHHLLATLFGEGLLMTVAGGAIGLLLAVVLAKLLVRFPITAALTPSAPMIPTPDVVAAILALTLLAVLVSSLPVGWFISRRRGRHRMVLAGGRSGDARRSWRLHELLVTAEVACSVVLLSAAGWILMSWYQRANIELGFDPVPVEVFELDLLALRASEEQKLHLMRELRERVESLAGVERAALCAALPLGRYRLARDLSITPGGPRSETDQLNVSLNVVTPGYLETLEIPRLRGRGFDTRDASGAPRTAIVNHALVERLWPDGGPLGRTLSLSDGRRFVPLRVVGVVADSQSERTLQREAKPHVYVPLAQDPQARLYLLVKGRPGASIVPVIQEEIRRMAPDLAVEKELSLEDHVAAATVRERRASVLLGTAGSIALFLTASGIFSFVALLFGHSREQIAVRIVLGASRGRAVAPLVSRGLLFTALGLAPGYLMTLGFRGLLNDWLPNLAPDAVWTFPVAASVVLLVAAAACYLPARRVARIEPAEVLATT